MKSNTNQELKKCNSIKMVYNLVRKNKYTCLGDNVKIEKPQKDSF